MTDIELIPVLLTGIDDAADRLRARLTGLGTAEYFWEPAPGAWSLREVDGRWKPDRAASRAEEPDPAPVTTIAWRLWHLSSCLAEYVAEFGDWPLAAPEGEGVGTAGEAVADFDTAARTFRARITALGEGGLRRPLGAAWGPFAEQSWAALVVHAQDELSHHGAEIALLRDLHPHLAEVTPAAGAGPPSPPAG